MQRGRLFLLLSFVALVVPAVIWVRAPAAGRSEGLTVRAQVALGSQVLDQTPRLVTARATLSPTDTSSEAPPNTPPRAPARPRHLPIVPVTTSAPVSAASSLASTQSPSTLPGFPAIITTSGRPALDVAVEPSTITDEVPADRLAESRGLRAALPNPLLFVRGAASSSDVVLEVDRGVQKPVALLENKRDFSPEQAKAKDLIAEDFAEKVSSAARDQSGRAPPVDQVWLEEQARANERYRLFFGDDAYNLDTVRAAQEALEGA